jgi:flagellar motor switch protein FliG
MVEGDVMPSQQFSGIQKAAIFFLSIDEDSVVEIFRHMETREVEQITTYMARLGKVPAEDVQAVLDEFDRSAAAPDIIAPSNSGYLKRVLARAFGERQAAVRALQELDPRTLLSLIGNEHPQIVAFIIAHLPSNAAVQVLSGIPEKQRADVLSRIIHLESFSPEVITEIEGVLMNKMSSMRGLGNQKVGGIQVAIDLLNQMDRTTMNDALAKIAEEDAGLAEEINKRLFSFDDLAGMDTRGLQVLLKEVGRDDLLLALKASSEEIKQRIFKNMSERAAQMLREDLEALGPVRLRDVEKSQHAILAVARKLEAEGKLSISGRGGAEEVFV